jgi:hypothetical protein
LFGELIGFHPIPESRVCLDDDFPACNHIAHAAARLLRLPNIHADTISISTDGNT